MTTIILWAILVLLVALICLVGFLAFHARGVYQELLDATGAPRPTVSIDAESTEFNLHQDYFQPTGPGPTA